MELHFGMVPLYIITFNLSSREVKSCDKGCTKVVLKKDKQGYISGGLVMQSSLNNPHQCRIAPIIARVRKSNKGSVSLRPETVLLFLIKRRCDRRNPTNPSSQGFRGAVQLNAGHHVLTRELESWEDVLWLGCKGNCGTSSLPVCGQWLFQRHMDDIQVMFAFLLLGFT